MDRGFARAGKVPVLIAERFIRKESGEGIPVADTARWNRGVKAMRVKGGRKGKTPQEKLFARRAKAEISIDRQRSNNWKPNFTGPPSKFNIPGSLNRKKG